MAKKTQGSNLYFVGADGTTLHTVAFNSLSGISSQRDQIEITTCADDARQYMAGLVTPGQAQFGIFFDPSNANHMELLALHGTGANTKWAVGLADDTAVPTVTAGDLTLPATRDWIKFDAYVADLPFDIQQNSAVQSNVSLQLSGMPTFVKATA